MDLLKTIFQIIIGLGLLNVWLVRPNKKTSFRGGGAENMKEEFAIYGLPAWFFWLAGILKVTSGVAMLLGIVIPALVLPAAILISILMLGAVAMHFKVKDPVVKSLPALSMLAMAVFLTWTRLTT